MNARATDPESTPTPAAHVEVRPATFRAADGQPLAATFFTPARPRAAVLIAAGTGIPRYVYARFAAWLAGRGYGVMTFDYRGIGDARPERLRGFRASKIDWGVQDMSAAFAALRRRWPDRPHYVLGHSVGGQLLGLMQGVEHIDGVATYGAGFGYWRALTGRQRWLAATMWYLGIPLTTALLGYLPARRLGLGEDLPAEVARDWARWGKRADYFRAEIGEAPGFQRLSAPWRAFLATDDAVATPANALPLYAMYRTPIEVTHLDPATFGYPDLGHIDFFRGTRSAAWSEVADWFDGLG